MNAAWTIWDDEAGGQGTIDSHPIAGPGPLDLYPDGIMGEIPVNHDPKLGQRWDEADITADTWVLNINEPIITSFAGGSWPWNNPTVLDRADGFTRRYNYDMDITSYPPPCFPFQLTCGGT